MKSKAILTFALLLSFVAAVGAKPDQPMMQAALGNLQTAKGELQSAIADKAGHRVRAIRLVNSAITEVQRGIAYDRRHNHASSLTAETLFAGAPDQPHMQSALDALRAAKGNLEQATTDKGGHRVKALEYINTAIDEVRLGISAGR